MCLCRTSRSWAPRTKQKMAQNVSYCLSERRSLMDWCEIAKRGTLFIFAASSIPSLPIVYPTILSALHYPCLLDTRGLVCCQSVSVLQRVGHRDFAHLWQCPVNPVSPLEFLSFFQGAPFSRLEKNWSAFGNDFSMQKRAHKHDVSSFRSCIFASNRRAH